MKKLLLNALLAGAFCYAQAQELPVLETGGKEMPDAWIDKETGHKVIRLVRRDGLKTTNASFYFNNYCFVPQGAKKGDLMVFYGSTVNEGRQLFSLNLKTLETKQLTNKVRPSGEMVCQKTQEAFYQTRDSVFAVNVVTGVNRFVYAFPADFKGRAGTINADGTYLAVIKADPKEREIYAQYPEKSQYFNRIYDAHLLRVLYSLNVKTGEMKEIHRENEWTNHLLFSPVDPDILSYCHEGPWEKNDRIWNVNIKTGENKLMHKRTMPMEIAGHEFFGIGGQHEWFDLQKPKGQTFFLAGVNMKTGKEDRIYEMDRNEWSIHFNVTKDEKTFCGDGGDPRQVAKAPDGQWIYLFKPNGERLKSEKLVNMKNHNYRLEPNVHFSPDEKWVIFRANFENGVEQVYAVEVGKK